MAASFVRIVTARFSRLFYFNYFISCVILIVCIFLCLCIRGVISNLGRIAFYRFSKIGPFY